MRGYVRYPAIVVVGAMLVASCRGSGDRVEPPAVTSMPRTTVAPIATAPAPPPIVPPLAQLAQLAQFANSAPSSPAPAASAPPRRHHHAPLLIRPTFTREPDLDAGDPSGDPIAPLPPVADDDSVDQILVGEPNAIPLAAHAPRAELGLAAAVHHSLGTAAAERANRYGVMLDVGVPDGATIAAVYRPWRPLRLEAGVSYNDISNGIRGGVTLVPLPSWVSPTLSIDYGHYAEGDANPLARRLSGNPMYSSAALDRVGYDYVDAHVGLELGRKWFTFYLHAGASRVTASVHDAAALVGNMPKTTISFLDDPTLTVTTVSARVGFIVYFAK